MTVRFEKENLDTETMGGELILSILATVAQEESNSISENINWSRRKHIEKGQPWEKARYHPSELYESKSVNHHSRENVQKTVLHPSEILILIKKCKSPFGTEKTDDIVKNGPDTYIIPSPLLTNLEKSA